MESWNHHFTSGKVSNTLYSSKLDPSKSLVTTDQEYSYFQDPHSYFYSPNFSQNRYAVDSQNFQGSTAYVYSTHIAAAKLTTTQLENFMEEDEIHRIYLNKTLPQLNTDRFMNRTDGSTLRHEGYFSFDTSQADQVLFTPYFGNEQKVDESYREGGYNHNLLSDLLSKPNHYTSLLDKKDTQENLQRLNNSFIDRQLNLSSVDFGAPLYNSAQYLSKLTSVNDCDQIIGDKSYTDPFLNETFSLSLEKNQLQANLPESSDKNWTEVEKKINKILEAVSNQSSYILPPIIEKSEKESPPSPTETTAGSLTSIKDEAILSELNIDTNSQLISELKDCVSKYRRDSNIVIGLKNSGLSCYINVILHCLLNAPLLAHYLLERYHDKERNPKSRGMISYIFGEMLTILSKHDANLNNSDVAQDLNESASFLRLHMSWKLNSSFQRGIQNDAIEFLKMFLGEMSEELNRVTYKPAYQELSTSLSPGESLQAKSQEWLRSLLVRENSIVTDLFGGQLLNTQYCRCSNKVSFDLFWDISLPINQKNTKFHTLEDLLRDYLQKEVLDKSCDCAKCFSPTVLKTQIWRLPEILVFTFKRFRTEGIWQKIDDSVIFPVKNLDLSSFIEESSDKSVQNANYTLFGIVKHAGSLDGGHYTAECLNIFNQKWYQLNDDYVENSRLTKETELYSCEPSILFYIKNSSLCL